MKSVGSLYYFGGVMGVFGGLTSIAVLLMPTTGRAPPAPGIFIGVMLVYLAFGVGALFLGYGFRRLKPCRSQAQRQLSSDPVATLAGDQQR